MKINEVAKLSNTSVRTLHYYDEIDLLNPKSINSSGYRIYDGENIKKLQQIMFLKEMDFSLKEIKSILNDKNYNEEKAFLNHKDLLIKKRNRLNSLINLVDKYIQGENIMSFKEFDMSEIETTKAEYKKEVKERWGSTKAYKQSKERTSSYSKEQWEKINSENNRIFSSFADIRHLDTSCERAQSLVTEWKEFINKYYYDCNNEILSSLSEMYINDERFKKNIDKFGDNTSIFISKAIKHYCK